MAERTNPAHDRVLLTAIELRAIAQLERQLAEMPAEGDEPGGAPGAAAVRDGWLRRALCGGMGFGSRLAMLGSLILVVGLFVAPVVAIVGAVLEAVGLVVWGLQLWLGGRRRGGSSPS